MKTVSFIPTPLVGLAQDLKKNRFDFAHPYQREANQWNDEDKYLLIDSLIRNYPINPIYITEKNETQDYVIDGGNRLSIIHEFLTNKLVIPRTWPQILTDEGWVSISGKSFSELSPICKDRILGYPIQICNLRGATQADIKEIFARINNGVQITNAQFNAIFIPQEISKDFNDLMCHEIFDIVLTKLHRKKANHRNFLIRIIMLLDDEYNLKNLYDYTVRRYIESIDSASSNNKEKIKQISLILNKIKNIFDFICQNFEEEHNKITLFKLPFICYATNLAFDLEKNGENYLCWLDNYVENFDESGGINTIYNSKNLKQELEKCKSGINNIH